MLGPKQKSFNTSARPTCKLSLVHVIYVHTYMYMYMYVLANRVENQQHIRTLFHHKIPDLAMVFTRFSFRR